MAGTGPAPKDPAARRRRNVAIGRTLLPAAGRVGPTPAWPLRMMTTAVANLLNQDEFTVKDAKIPIGADAIRDEARELEIWERLWKSPQAVAWEQSGSEIDVAVYVRHLVQAEGGDMKAAAEARQWSDRLGLNPKAMRNMLWEVVDMDAVAEKRDEKAAPSRTAAKRAKLKIVG